MASTLIIENRDGEQYVKFECSEKVGKGGFAQVWKAKKENDSKMYIHFQKYKEKLVFVFFIYCKQKCPFQIRLKANRLLREKPYFNSK